MNVKYYGLVFFLVMAVLLIKIDTKINSLEVMDKRASDYNEAIDNAVDDSLNSVVEVTDAYKHNINLDKCSDTFFRALYAGFGLTDSKVGQQQLASYVPILLITDTDGFYVMYQTLSLSQANTSKQWTEKQPYCDPNTTMTSVVTKGDVDEYCQGDEGYWGGSLDSFADTVVGKKLGYRIAYTMSKKIKLEIMCYGTNPIDNTQNLEPSEHYYYEGDFDALLPIYGDGLNLAGDSGASEKLRKYELLRLVTGMLKSTILGEDFYKYRDSVMICQITQKCNYYVNRHNAIAQSFGVNYTFSLPESSTDTFSRTIEGVSMLAIFQGYPYGKGSNDVYSRFSISGAHLVKGTKYYVTGTGKTRYYHRSTCSHVTEGLEAYDTRKECAEHYAYPCPDCLP